MPRFNAQVGAPTHPGLLTSKQRARQLRPGENPYCPGQTLPGNSPLFYGRGGLLRQIGGQLKRSGKPACVNLIGERRFGKSSLINQLVEMVANQSGLVTIQTTAQNWPTITQSEFFAALSEAVRRVLALGDGDEATFDTFSALLHQQAEHQRFVLIIDEFETMAANAHFDTPFYQQLRSLADDPGYRFAFVLVSRLPVREVSRQHDQLDASSFWSIFGLSKTIGLLTPGEAEALIREPWQRSGQSPLSDQLHHWLLSDAGAHPAMLQMVLDNLWICADSHDPVTSDTLRTIRHGLDSYYDDLWKRRTKEEQAVLTRIVAGKALKDRSLYGDLQQRGLIDAEGRLFAPRFEELIHAKWFPPEVSLAEKVGALEERGGKKYDRLWQWAERLGKLVRTVRGTQSGEEKSDNDDESQSG